MHEKNQAVEQLVEHKNIDALILPIESQLVLAPQHIAIIAGVTDHTEKEILQETVAFFNFLRTNKRHIIDVPTSDWFITVGFSPELIDTPIYITDFEKIAYVQGQLSQKFDAIYGTGTTSTENNSITIRKFVELLRPILIAELYCHTQLNMAIEQLRKYLPAAELKCPVEILADFSLPGHCCYSGIFQNKHYIQMNPFSLSEAPYLPIVPSPTSVRQQKDTSALAHELIHAFHVEQAGVENVLEMVAAFDDLPEMLQLAKDASVHAVIHGLEEAMNNPRNRLYPESGSDNSESLVLLLCEGLATIAQIYILNQQINVTEPNSKQQLVLTKLRRNLLLEIRYRTQEDEPIADVDRHKSVVYAEGSRFVHRLIKAVGINALPSIIRAIDYTVCTQILPGSEEYLQIIQDPTKLPGLATILQPD